MKASHGEKQDRFDRHQWNAGSFELDELGRAVEELGIFGKRIVDIRLIGVARNLRRWELTMTARRICVGAGASYEEFDSGRYPYIDAIMVPCEAVVCEPVVFSFEDGSTFEIRAEAHGRVRMSVDQIPAGTVNGLNRTNADSRVVFSRLLGSAVTGVSTRRFHTDCRSDTSAYQENRGHYAVQFWMTGNFWLTLLRRFDTWVAVSVVDQRCASCEGSETTAIPYGEMKKATVPVDQIEIVEGHDSGSCFWIMPVRLAEPGEKARRGVHELAAEEISIEEDVVYMYLSVFLDKYFDEAASEPFRFACGPGFEWNLEYNIYPYKTVEAMLSDMRAAAASLLRGDDDPAFGEVRSRFGNAAVSAREAQRGADFYDRFCRRMEAVMARAPEYGLISFMGP